MDSQYIAIVSITISIFTGIVATLNHKRVRSNCCGHKLESSIDIESTTPPNIKIPEIAKK
jgi:hypothetical protein